MRRRILLLTVGMTAVVILAFAGPLAVLIHDSVQSRALDEARFEAENVAYFIGAVDPDGDHVANYLKEVNGRYAGQAWVQLPDGSVVGQPPAGWSPAPSGSAGASTDDSVRRDDVGDVSAASVDALKGGSVTRVQAVTRQGPSTVLTYLDADQMNHGLAARWLLLAAVSGALLLLSFVGAEVVSARMTRPLEQTARTAERLASGDTGARAPEAGPVEVAKVGSALNGLADRIDEVIAVEREAVADLSHRLRTPLTALRLDVDALADRETALSLGAHVTSLERTLTTVIHAARRPQREGRVPRCDATQVVGSRADFWTPLAEDQGRSLSLSLPAGPVLVRSADEDLSAAVDALIENVIAHTPDGTDLSIDLRRVDGTEAGAVLRVCDSGDGIPGGAGQRGRSDRGSTGLGLDIARRCAEISGGSIRISDNSPHGAVVELTLGAA